MKTREHNVHATRGRPLQKGKAAEPPSHVRPMLATLSKEVRNDPAYLYEIKWDGYRLIVYKIGGRVLIQSRGGHDYTKKYPSVVRAFQALPNDLVVDGEIVVLSKEGKPDYDALQRFNGQKHGVTFYVFDVLWQDGYDVTQLPLVERKQILSTIIKQNPILVYSEHFDDGEALFTRARHVGLEGIVAKLRTSKYIQNDRSRKWLKIPTELKQEFVIGGWVESQSGRLFRTLLFGAYNDDKLEWIGHAGSGYKENEMPAILQKLKRLEISESPFTNDVDYDGVVHWVKPVLVANVKYSTWTKGGKIRKPAVFLGFREDKAPHDVKREEPMKTQSNTRETSAESNWSTLEKRKVTTREDLDFGDCKIEVTNVEKEIWKGITKAHLLQYYSSVSKFILPHLKNRPLSLYVKPDGPMKPGLYIKDMEGRQPECAEVFSTERKHKKEGKRDVIDYLVCNNLATLLYVINLGSIDINPWTSTTNNDQYPDFIVIDLDPSDSDFQKAIDAALAAKDLFDQLKLKCFVKTSGKTGMHLLLPCNSLNFSEARIIAENICQKINEQLPSITTTEVSVADRGTKLYLDPNQNDYSDTVASAYSVRPHYQPTVSTPLVWKEIKSSLNPADFTISTVGTRLAKKGDLFEDVFSKTIAEKNTLRLKKFF